MTDFSIYVIESKGDYYYSLKTEQNFRSAIEATMFRSEKAAQKMIRNAIKLHTEYVARTEDRWPDLADNAKALIVRWSEAKIIKIA